MAPWQARTVITVVGNLTNDPELRFTPVGGRGRQLHRRLDPADASTGRPTSGRTATRCSCAARLAADAENVAESLHQGIRVIVHGRLKQRSYETT